MQRFPDGIDEEGFYQKETPDYFPSWIKNVKVEVEEENEKQSQVICNNKATIVYLANQACITLHTWLCRKDKLYYPDKLIFDLDPPGKDFEIVRFGAFSLRDVINEVGLKPFVMTTGSRGLHVVVPLDKGSNFDEVRKFGKSLASIAAKRESDKLTLETRKEKRGNRLFLDYLRNSYAQTSVCPYALRAKPKVPVATPLEWKELKDKSINSQSYTIRNIFKRLGQKNDPWKKIMQHTQSLNKPIKELNHINS
jgi:bifunctional non-homologous end joining protein LigD